MDMKIKTIHVLASAMLLLIGGCSDTVTTHYPTRGQAEADILFQRGWLPILIPASARDITTSNDLDINASKGEFWYDPKDTNSFLSLLKPYSGHKPKHDRRYDYVAKQKKEGYEAFEYESENSIWVFLINGEKEKEDKSIKSI
mgnify:FL=1